MDDKLGGLIAKLMMLGNRVKVIDDTSVIATDAYTNKMKVIAREHGKVVISEEFDDVEHLPGSEYTLVRIRKKYGILHRANKLARERMYSELGKGVLASTGKYNMIAKLSNGLYGVVDTDDATIIPFYHSQMQLYKMINGWVYVGDTLDIKKVYKDNGELHGVSNKIDVVNDIIVCSDFIVMYDTRNRRNYGKCTVFDPDGKVILTNNTANIVNEGVCHQLVDFSGEVLINNIVECKKY